MTHNLNNLKKAQRKKLADTEFKKRVEDMVAKNPPPGVPQARLPMGVAPEFEGFRGLLEDLNRFMTINNGKAPDVRIRVSTYTPLTSSTPDTGPQGEILDVTDLMRRLYNYTALLETAAFTLFKTGDPEQLIAVRSARDLDPPKPKTIIMPDNKIIH